LIAIDAKSIGDKAQRRPIGRRVAGHVRLAAQGKGVILSRQLRAPAQAARGGSIELASPTGLHRFPILAWWWTGGSGRGDPDGSHHVPPLVAG